MRFARGARWWVHKSGRGKGRMIITVKVNGPHSVWAPHAIQVSIETDGVKADVSEAAREVARFIDWLQGREA